MPFGSQQLTFQLQAASVSAQTAAGTDHAVTGRRCITALPEDAADRTVGPWRAG